MPTSPDSIDYIHALRAEELERVLQAHGNHFYHKDVLEIGSGSGFQLKILSSVCRSAVGLETADSWYKQHRIAEIKEYDGRRIPFPDASFDTIFSSNLLQYISHERQLYDEMRRVLRPGGAAVHVVPTSVWRFWTSVLHYPAKARLLMRRLLPSPAVRAAAAEQPKEEVAAGRLGQVLANVLLLHRLGTRGNWFTEHFIFQSRAWRRTLQRYGWVVEKIIPMDLWYSGQFMAGPAFDFQKRTRLARILGSSAITILAKPEQNPST